MPLKVTANYPQHEKGLLVSVGSAFAVANGGTIELTVEQEQAFVIQFGESVRDRLAKHPNLKVDGTAELKGSEVSAITRSMERASVTRDTIVESPPVEVVHTESPVVPGTGVTASGGDK